MKTLRYALAFVCLSGLAFAQASRYENVVDTTVTISGQTGLRKVVPNAQVTLCKHPAATFAACSKVPLCPDSTAVGCSTATNPVTADAYGNFGFYVRPAEYDYWISSGGSNSGPYDITLSADNASTRVNVLANKYGVSLVADGSTDNCAAWGDLQSAVPEGSILYFPKGTYYVNSSNCGGFILSKRLSIEGESSGWFSGTSVIDAALFTAPINLNNKSGVSVKHIATDCRTWGAVAACDGISSGEAAVGAGGSTVIDDYLYVGTRLTNPAHGVLLQSGPYNRVTNIRTWSAFHFFAIRSPMTIVSDFVDNNSVDGIVKSAEGSGDVFNVSISNGVMWGSDGVNKNGAMLSVTSQSAGVNTFNVNVSNVSFDNSAYGLEVVVDDGGNLFGVTATNLSGFNMTTPLYFHTNSGAHTCENVKISNASFQNSTSTGLENTLGCLNVVTNGVSINGSILPQQLNISGGSTNKATCWKDNGVIGYCSTQPDTGGTCTCN